MELSLDLDGKGEKKYYLERDWKIQTHKDRTGEDEEGYEDIKTAIQNSELETIDIENKQVKDVEGEEKEKQYKEELTGGKSVEQAIDELEQSLKDKTGDNKIQFGHIAYWLDEDQKIAYRTSNDEDDEGWNNAEKYFTDVESSEELTKIIQILTTYELVDIETNSNGKSSIKIKDANDENVKRIRQIFIDHFKNGDIIDIAGMFYNRYDQDEIAIPDYNNWRGWKQYIGFGNGSDDKADPSGPNKELIDNNVTIYCSPNGYDDEYNDGSDYYIPGILYVIATDNTFHCDYYWQMRIEDIWSWFFEGVELKEVDHWYDFITDGISKHIPTRYYYRLIDVDTKDVVKFDLQDDNDFVYYDDMNTYYIDNEEGWFWRKAIPRKLYNAIMKKEGEEEAGSADEANKEKVTEVYDLLNTAYDTNTEDYTRYVPIILSVTGHWYEDVDYKGCWKWSTDEEDTNRPAYIYTAKDTDKAGVKNASEAGIIYMKEDAEGTIEQVAEGKITKNDKLSHLVNDNEYYKYDGYGRSEEKSKIDFKDTAVDAIAMLEQVEGESAQHIIRMFKEFMITQGITFEETQATSIKKELFSKVIRGYSGELLTDNESDTVYRAEIPPTQKGFAEGLIVQSPINGRITYRTDDSVCILIDDENFEDLRDYTILISGFDVDTNITKDTKVKWEENKNEGTVLGKTKRQDLKLVLRDENGAIVKNEYVAKNLSSSISGGQVVSKADEIMEYMINNKYDYVQGNQVPMSKNGKQVDCSTFICWILYDLGVENAHDGSGGQLSTFAMDTNGQGWFSDNGWIKVNSYSELQPGDIVIMSGGGTANGHVQVFAYEKDGKRYYINAGYAPKDHTSVYETYETDFYSAWRAPTGLGLKGETLGGAFSASENDIRTEADILYVIENNDLFKNNANEIENVKQMIPALLQMQKNYDIDPLAALAVFHQESHCGTAYSGEIRIANIQPYDEQKVNIAGTSNGFCTYNSLSDAVLDFGNYVRFRLKGATTWDDLENYQGLAIFESAATKDKGHFESMKSTLKNKK